MLLIGGTSHVGKSTLAARLADALGWQVLSTDQLARHPGRPWRDDDSPLPQDVVDYYGGLTVDAQIHSVLTHYEQNVWPIADAIVRSRLQNPYDRNLILEGSALLPDCVLAANHTGVIPVWLTEEAALITERILSSSDRSRGTPVESRLIDAFLSRSLALNSHFIEAASRNGQTVLSGSKALEILLEACE